MTPEEQTLLTEKINAVLERFPEVQCCFLLGSAAAGTLRPDSDIDLAVACRELMTPEAKMALLEALAAALPREIDLTDLRAVSGTYLRHALSGKLLLCRDVSVKAELMTAMVYDQEDFQPLRRRMMDARRERVMGRRGDG